MTVDKSSISSLISSSLLVFTGTVLIAFASFFERIIIARQFGLEQYGAMSIGLAIMSIVSYLSMAGLNHGVPRYISRFEDDADLRGIWQSGALVAIGVSVVTTVVLLANVGLIATLLFDDAPPITLITLFVLSIPLTAGFRMGLGTLRGLENTRYNFLVGDFLYPLLRIGVLVGLIVTGAGIVAAGYAYVVASAAAFVAVYAFIDQIVPLFGPTNFRVRTIVVFSAPLMLSEILAVLLTRTDLLLIGYFHTSSQAGLYSAAYSLSRTILYLVGSLSYLYLPLTSRLDADGDHDEINDLYQVTTKWGFIVTFPLFVVFVAFAGDILAMTFGPEYQAAALTLIVLTLGFISDAAFGRNRPTLNALGSTKRILWADVAAITVNLMLNLALIPAFGFLGAAVASTAAYLGRNVVMYAVLRYEFGITPFSPSLVRTFLVLPAVMLVPAVVAGQLFSMTLVLLPVTLVVVGIATLITAFVSGCVRPDDMVVLEVIEDAIGVRIPYVRQFVTSQ